MNLRTLFGHSVSTISMLFLTACGGGSDWVQSDVLTSMPTYGIGGTVSGLDSGARITLSNNGSDSLSVGANGSFAFANAVLYNGAYVVTVDKQPSTQTCTVSHGSGAGVVANVASIDVTCSTTAFAVAGTVVGLAAGTQVTLRNNDNDALTRTADGNFSFATPVALNGGYAVTVQSQPVGQTCTVMKGTASGVVTNVSNVAVVCSVNTYTVSGAVSGLGAGMQVTLNNNSSDTLTVDANGAFTFRTPVANNGGFGVTVGTQPIGQICTVSGGSGTGVMAIVSNVGVTCSASTFTISGKVSGLAAGKQVTISNNGADAKTISADGTFTFTTPVAYNSSYAVTVGTQPATEICRVTSGADNRVMANIATVSVTCLRRSRFAYQTNSAGGSVSQFTIGDDGQLEPMNVSSVATGHSPSYVAVDPTGRYAYVTNFNDDSVSQYSIGTDGALTALSPATVPVGDGPQSVTIDRSGQHAYVVNRLDHTVRQFAVAMNGSLTPMETPSVAVDESSFYISLDPTGRFAYVPGYNSESMQSFTIAPDGSLVPINSSSAEIYSNPDVVTFDPTGRYAYIDETTGVVQFALGDDGSLTSVGTPAPVGGYPYDLVMDPAGRYLYSVDYYGVVKNYQVGANGAISYIGDVLTGSNYSYFIAVDTAGLFAYVANYNKTISQYAIGTAGLLQPLGTLTINTGSPGGFIALTPGN